MTDKLDRYNQYCYLLSKLDEKKQQLSKLKQEEGKLNFDIGSLERDIKEYSELSSMNNSQTAAIKRMRMQSCLRDTVHFDDGGSVGGVPVKDFKKSEDFKEMTKEKIALFDKVENILSESQYSIQNALIIAKDEDEDFDIYASSAIEDKIDEMMQDITDYEELDAEKLKKIKQIIYIFVEHTLKEI